MDSVRLITPEAQYLESYLDFCREMAATGITYFTIDDPDKYSEWKDTILGRYADNRAGINLPEGYVPATSLWLVDDDEVVGACNIRHYLNDALRQMGGHIGYAIKPSKWRRGYGELQLALALTEAKRLGIEEALVTCDDANIGSARVIEKNGGVLEGIYDIQIEGRGPRIRRYWVPTR